MLNQFIRAVFLSAMLVLPFTQSHAWWDAGHKTVAEIAYEDLTPEAKRSVDQIVEAFHFSHPSYETFADLATWPDHLQPDEKLFLYTDLHYIVLPFDPEGVLSDDSVNKLQIQAREDGALVSIERAKTVLANKEASVFSKCWALSYLTHVVADIHQPLHCCTRFSKDLPDGDMGGNFHPIIAPKNIKAHNLHQLWDGGAGLLPTLSGDKVKDANTLSLFAKSIREDLPKEKLAVSHIMDPKKWGLESHTIATEHAHTLKPNTRPTPFYLKTSSRIAKERIALAGYRLSFMLNEVFSVADEPVANN